MVLYTFYEKPMSTNQVLHKDTALAEDTKISSLTAEVKRRMLNCSELLPNWERLAVVDRFAQKMANSGYNKAKIRAVIVAGLKGYETRVTESKQKTRAEYKPIHESAVYSCGTRSKKKLTGKSQWFNGNNRENEKKEKSYSKPEQEVEDKTAREKTTQEVFMASPKWVELPSTVT